MIYKNAYIMAKRGNLRFLCRILRKFRNLCRFEDRFSYALQRNKRYNVIVC